MKKILAMILCISMILSLGFCVSAAGFSDLAADHWAYNDITTLVNEGTINGYTDGTFKPSKTVTRAEFVKMIGKWDKKSDVEFSDLSPEHWAYEYLMWSGLEPAGISIMPDVEIKRSDVINLIWKRNGSPKNDSAPSVITNQGKNKDAVSWAYTIGLMQGNDGLNLRLDSSLTRAEAATLIVRSRKLVAENNSVNFVDTVSDELLKFTYEGLNLIADPYRPNKELTYTELARMSYRFGANGSNVGFVGDDRADEPIDHVYAHEMHIMTSKVWGDDMYTMEMADKQATVQDAIGAIMHGFTRRGTAPSDMGKMNEYYSDCKDVNKGFENIYLTYANKKGIKLFAGSELGADEPITVKKYTALLVQFNEIVGLGVKYENGEIQNAKICASIDTLPGDYKAYKTTIDEIPMEIYNMKAEHISAKSRFNFLNQCAFVFNSYLGTANSHAKQNTGYTMNYTYYPSVSYFNDSGNVVFVTKMSVNLPGENVTSISVDELFKDVITEPTGKTVKPKQDFFVVFETNGAFMDVSLAYDEAHVKAVVIP